MSRRFLRLLALGLAVCAAAFWWGCSQPEDIVVGKGETIVDLNAERLPTPPDGMYYKLWVADTLADHSVQGAHEIGSFIYDFETQTYFDQSGVERADSNRFVFPGDVLDYQWMVVSVQRTDGSDGGGLGPVILIDTITAAFYGDIDMICPLGDSLWLFTADYNMETPSNGRDSLSDGYGIWFSAYNERTRTFTDTTELRRFTIDTTWRDSFPTGEGPCVTNIVNIINIHPETLQVPVGFDTVSQIVVRFDYETYQECDTGQDSVFTTAVTSIEYRTSNTRLVTYDDFQQVALPLPDLSSYGWKYKGWVVSSAIPSEASLGTMTMPAWRGEFNNARIVNPDGGLLTTGTFTDLFAPDDANPYVEDPARVPPYPGEDFVANLPNDESPINLVPNDGGATGTVFISLEPNNMVTAATNFPLIALTSDLPGTRGLVQDVQQQFIMFNQTRSVRGDLVGFPRVKAVIDRR